MLSAMYVTNCFIYFKVWTKLQGSVLNYLSQTASMRSTVSGDISLLCL